MANNDFVVDRMVHWSINCSHTLNGRSGDSTCYDDDRYIMFGKIKKAFRGYRDDKYGHLVQPANRERDLN